MISILLAVLAIVAFFAGIIGMAVPAALKLPTRWHGAFLSSLFLPLIGSGMFFDPPPVTGTAQEQEAAAYAPLTAFLLWLGVVFVGWLVKRAVEGRGNKLSKAPEKSVELPAAMIAETLLPTVFPVTTISTPAYRAPPPPPPPPPPSIVDRAPEIQAAPRRSRNRKGREIRFVYVDAHGEVTDREVLNWRILGGKLEGYCTMRKATRIFNVDRVVEWIDER